MSCGALKPISWMGGAAAPQELLFILLDVALELRIWLHYISDRFDDVPVLLSRRGSRVWLFGQPQVLSNLPE